MSTAKKVKKKSMVCFIKLKVIFDIEEMYWRKLKEMLKDINKMLKDKIMNKSTHKIQTLITLIMLFLDI